MSAVLLLDLDHTLYPSTLPTGDAVDSRIVRYIREHLGLSPDDADALRRKLSAKYGTTLKGLEILHGVDREHYCDFIQDLEDALMPPPDPRLRAWLSDVVAKVPTYLFTNSRRDWVDRCLASLGLADLLPGVLDIGFMEWVGKPEAVAFARAESFIRGLHGDVRFIFADDRLDNLEQARLRGWSTIWIRPHDAPFDGFGWLTAGSAQEPHIASTGHRVVNSLLELDIQTLL